VADVNKRVGNGAVSSKPLAADLPAAAVEMKFLRLQSG
jgi:hypothetical protein